MISYISQGDVHSFHGRIIPIGPMGLEYLPTNLPNKSKIHGGKYTSPMDHPWILIGIVKKKTFVEFKLETLNPRLPVTPKGFGGMTGLPPKKHTIQTPTLRRYDCFQQIRLEKNKEKGGCWNPYLVYLVGGFNPFEKY